MPRVQKSYYIHKRRTGNVLGDLTPAWGFDDDLPTEWEETKQDQEVQEAAIFRSSQRRVRADRRKILDSYTRPS